MLIANKKSAHPTNLLPPNWRANVGRRVATKNSKENVSKEQAQQDSIKESSQRQFDVDKLQLQLAVDTYKSLYALLVAIATGLAAADVSLLNYGINNKSAPICIFASFFVVTIHLMRLMFETAMLPLVYTAIRIEQKYAEEGNAEGLVTTFLFSMSANTKKVDEHGATVRAEPYQYVRSLVDMALSNSPHEEKIRELRRTPPPCLRPSHGHAILISALLVHACLAAWCFYAAAHLPEKPGEGNAAMSTKIPVPTLASSEKLQNTATIPITKAEGNSRRKSVSGIPTKAP